MQTYIRWMDAVSHWAGVFASWALLAACLISAGNASLRYTLNIGSNAWLEVQWYLFGLAVFAGAPMLLKLNEHVRVDVVFGGLSERAKAWIDVVGILLVLLPLCVFVSVHAWPFVTESFAQHEVSPSAGGLLRWPIKAAIPLGFGLLALQGVAELFRRLLFLQGRGDFNAHYERPLQ